jgi:tetratricopeptide (TPR) repeat protein
MTKRQRQKQPRMKKTAHARVLPSSPRQSEDYLFVFWASVMVLLVVMAYMPALTGGFVWDDDYYVTNNPTLRSLAGLAQIWFQPQSTPQYYPLVFSTFWLEYHLWGLNPAGYHAVNVVLQAANALLLWILLKRLGVPGAWLAAAVFAVHPVHVESVAWVTERKNVLSGLFYLGAAMCLLRVISVEGDHVDPPGRWRWYAAALVLFLCALLSKSVTCSLPAAMVLLAWWKRGRIRGRLVVVLMPLFVLGLAFGLWTAWLERHHVGAEGFEWQLTLVDSVLVAGRALWFYAGKLLCPTELTFTYPHWDINAHVWWQYAYPLGVLLVVSALWVLRNRIGRGALTGVLYFCITLFPALGFFPVYPFRFSYVADHFQYLASLGLIALAVGALTRGASRLPSSGRNLVRPAALALLGLLSVLTWRQSSIYVDSETLWRDTLAKNPTSWHRHYDLATLLAWKGKLDEAITQYNDALRLKPDYADAHNNLGIALFRKGDYVGAVQHFTEALRLEPLHREAHYNLATLLAVQGNVREAIENYREHLRIRPDHAEAHYNLGLLLAQEGRLEAASKQFSEALRIKPDYEAARRNLNFALQLLGRPPSKSATPPGG